METFQYPRRTSRTFIVKRRRLSRFGHVCRHDMLPKIILLGTRSRRRWRPCKSWSDNIKEWTDQSLSLLRTTDNRSRGWATKAAEASVGVSRPNEALGGVAGSFGCGLWRERRLCRVADKNVIPNDIRVIVVPGGRPPIVDHTSSAFEQAVLPL